MDHLHLFEVLLSYHCWGKLLLVQHREELRILYEHLSFFSSNHQVRLCHNRSSILNQLAVHYLLLWLYTVCSHIYKLWKYDPRILLSCLSLGVLYPLHHQHLHHYPLERLIFSLFFYVFCIWCSLHI